jgi:segregation and condensation protein A
VSVFKNESIFEAMSFHIKIPVFEGPFDLLLFFIERDELDIYNIPISKITNDFLDYIHQLDEMNIDLASEFMIVAATLMRIKAKMLLPRKELDESGNEIDPREELAQKLIEYRKYKAIIEDLQELESDRMARFTRGYAAHELKMLSQKALIDAELESLTVYKLLKAYERVLDRVEKRKSKTIHRIRNYNYTIEDQQSYIVARVNKLKKASFDQLFEVMENRIHAIITFLALLELLNLQKVGIRQGSGINNFWLVPVELNKSEEE